MWVNNGPIVERLKPSYAPVSITRFTHRFSHRLKDLNSPLKWGYDLFPQVTGLVTTTTYNYIKTPVRFPLVNSQIVQLLKEKTCNVLLQKEG